MAMNRVLALQAQETPEGGQWSSLTGSGVGEGQGAEDWGALGS